MNWLELAAAELLVHAPECPTLLARDYLNRALVTVASDAGLETHARKLVTIAGARDYPLDPPSGRALAGVLAVRLNGRVVAYRVTDCGIRLVDPPGQGEALEAEMQLAAAATMQSPQSLQDAVVNYALSRLLLIPQQRWSNPAMAGSFLALYQQAKAKLVDQIARTEQLQRGEEMPRMRGIRWV